MIKLVKICWQIGGKFRVDLLEARAPRYFDRIRVRFIEEGQLLPGDGIFSY